MASLNYKMGLNKKAMDFSMQGKDADGDGKADQIDEDGDGVLDELYVCAAPGIDPFVAKAAKTPKSTTTDCYRAIVEDKPSKDSRLHNKFMPGYGGYVPTEMAIKTEGGQWSPPKYLEVEAKMVRATSTRESAWITRPCIWHVHAFRAGSRKLTTLPFAGRAGGCPV